MDWWYRLPSRMSRQGVAVPSLSKRAAGTPRKRRDSL